MLGYVCATPRDGGSLGSDSTACFPTMAACRAGPGRSPRCSKSTTGRPASPRPLTCSTSRGRILGTPCVLQRRQRKRGGAMARLGRPSSPNRAGDRKAARGVDVQFQAWRAMSPIVWNGSAWSITRTVTPQLVRSRYVSSDSTLRHASAQQCLHKLPYGAPPLNALVKSASLPICGSQRRGAHGTVEAFLIALMSAGILAIVGAIRPLSTRPGLRRHAPGGLGCLPGRTRSPRACMWCSAQ
jgi:hypothetical protein